MEPDKSALKLLPKPLVNSAARTATVNATLAGVLTVIGFVVLWAPLYLLRADGQLVLAPFVFICIPVIWYFAIRAIVFARRGLRWAETPDAAGATGLGVRAARRSLVGGIAAVVLPIPLFLFGGLPLTLLGLA
ncbi:hypothetical protein [Agreia sp. Leaf283]|uniref:hypothetical protein n=1 Tax=Agreia sp. Leaf283 TaxID=1736321 RepID=UPI0007003590|nr:hypothetical protein [Agreia sp. Leaf283]KQP53722.1 hypothetical protein ASF51_16290 [Agreia sp. Leaf283]